MATTVKRLCLAAPRRTYRSCQCLQTRSVAVPHARRTFSSTLYRKENEDDIPRLSTEEFASTLTETKRKEFEALSPEKRTEYQDLSRQLREHLSAPAVSGRLNSAIKGIERKAQSEVPIVRRPKVFIKEGLHSDGEDDVLGTGPDQPFKGDDISALGHGELEQQREIREYARIAAWEMPLLSKLAKPFTPPSAESPLRFRSTTYLGESHPAAKKIVLEFCTSDMPDLTTVQRHKLIKLAGPRYNPQTDIIKMSCEMFESAAQNKRYLGDLVGTMLREARDKSDTFEDVPFDFRHVKRKEKPRFPDEWLMTEERRQYLDGVRQEKKALAAQEKVVDGVQLIESAITQRISSQPEAVPVSAGGDKKGKKLRR
ncbi:MAG: N-acetylglucosaminyldiphosphodolichol N-acetylglucosaminyltransferase catalytic subunit alg13 [Chaenotheca gracillima]|nr:MAG: N-acetylglucosaminyldiphosphodolichol N-acetylglucosaminyltransferase catalytic subunit alg13 [Chaenotheca gracillima]